MRTKQHVTPPAPARPRISVVVPCRNVQDYLHACLDSILGQTYSNIEILCIEDASDDDTGKILNTYALADRRIHVLVNDHQCGLGESRNVGVRAATGEYIFFLDSDDLLAAKDIFQRLMDDIDRNDCQVALAQVKQLHEDGSLTDFNRTPETLKCISGDEACRRTLFLGRGGEIAPVIWGALFKASIWKEKALAFPSCIHEDLATTPFAYFLCEKIYISSVVGVLYRVREKSLSRSMWGAKEVESMSGIWKSMSENIHTYFPDSYLSADDLKHIASFLILHAFWKILENGMEPGARSDFLGNIKFLLAQSGGGKMPQHFFDELFMRLKWFLGSHGFDEIYDVIQLMPRENVETYYRSNRPRAGTLLRITRG